MRLLEDLPVVQDAHLPKFFVCVFKTIFFKQGLFPGEQIRADAKTAAFDGHAHTGQNGGEHIKVGVDPIEHHFVAFLGNRGGGIQDHIVLGAVVILIEIIEFEEIGLHAQMVADDDNGGIIIERLLLDPADKFIDLR